MGPSPHLWFLHSKQRLLDQNNKCLWVPALICGFGCKTATLGTVAVLHAKTTGGVLDPWKLVIQALITLFCMHKTTDEVWEP